MLGTVLNLLRESSEVPVSLKSFYIHSWKRASESRAMTFFPNSRMLWGLSPHSLRGAPGHCSTLPPRFAGSGNQGSENRFRTRVRGKVPGTQGSGNQGSGQGSRNPRFRKPDFQARFWEQWVLATFWVPGRQGSGKVPGTLGFRQGSGNLTMVSSSQSLDCAKVLESPEHQF